MFWDFMLWIFNHINDACNQSIKRNMWESFKRGQKKTVIQITSTYFNHVSSNKVRHVMSKVWKKWRWKLRVVTMALSTQKCTHFKNRRKKWKFKSDLWKIGGCLSLLRMYTVKMTSAMKQLALEIRLKPIQAPVLCIRNVAHWNRTSLTWNHNFLKKQIINNILSKASFATINLSYISYVVHEWLPCGNCIKHRNHYFQTTSFLEMMRISNFHNVLCSEYKMSRCRQ